MVKIIFYIRENWAMSEFVQFTVADPGFPGGGYQLLSLDQKSIIWQNFAENCMKMKEIWTGGGMACVPTTLTDSPMVRLGMSLIVTDFQQCAWLRPTSCWKICEYQSHPQVYWKKSNVAGLSLIWNMFVQYYFLSQLYWLVMLPNTFWQRPLL